jgi:hypothetical protein
MILPDETVPQEEASHPCNTYSLPVGIRDFPNSLLKSFLEQVLELLMAIVVAPSLRIHVAKHVLEPPQRNVEWRDPSLSPVYNPCYMPGFVIHKDIYLEEIVMTKY